MRKPERRSPTRTTRTWRGVGLTGPRRRRRNPARRFQHRTLLIGRRDHASYEGLAIPYFLPGESRIREWRLRRDHPDLEYKDGKPKERGKYMSPPGRRNMIYFVPGSSPDLVKAVDTPVVVTEGEFKTLALWRLANHESTAPRFLPLGIRGRLELAGHGRQDHWTERRPARRQGCDPRPRPRGLGRPPRHHCL